MHHWCIGEKDKFLTWIEWVNLGQIIVADIAEFGCQLGFESSDAGGVSGIVDEIGVLLGIVVGIEEFDAACGVFPVLHKGVAFLSEEKAFAHGSHAESGVTHLGLRFVEELGQAFALDVLRDLESAEFRDGGVEVQ
jgi:hypothetical protein